MSPWTERQKCCVVMLLVMMMQSVPGCQCVPVVSVKSSKSDQEVFEVWFVTFLPWPKLSFYES